MYCYINDPPKTSMHHWIINETELHMLTYKIKTYLNIYKIKQKNEISSCYWQQVPENAKTGTVVARVTATDADVGANGNVSYEVISDWGTDVFSLNPASGVFTLIGSLDYETASVVL